MDGAMVRTADITVAALELFVGSSEVACMATTPTGQRERFRVGTTADLIRRIDALRAELRDPMAISSGTTPRLREFASGWGVDFVAPLLAHERPDVLVIVPHGPTHDLPFHLIQVDEAPLGTRTGITYASSRSQFLRAIERNSARRVPATLVDESNATAASSRAVISGGTDVLGHLDEEFEAICDLVANAFDGE